jgi:hypothetical protein
MSTCLHPLVRARLDIATGLRGMVGVTIPLALGLALDQPVAGVFGAMGAVAVGFGAFQGAYRTRAAAMLAACLGVSLSLLLGTLASSSTIAATVLTAAAGFIAGLLVALGPAAAYVGLQCGIAVIFASGFPTTPRAARPWSFRRCWTRPSASTPVALHAHLEQRPVPAMPDVAELTRELQSSLAVLSRALATGTEPRSLPDLRSTHLALARTWSAGHSPTPDAALVLTETDLMVDGVKTVADLLRGRSLGDSR